MIKNNYYNFRNPVRHFLNIDRVRIQSGFENLEKSDFAWALPINFRVRKEERKYRTLKLPNIFNFLCALEKFKDNDNFLNPVDFDSRKRLFPNLTTGDFEAGVYDRQLENDFLELCIYDYLMKLDIKAYYERIYTHDITFQNAGDENYLTNLNAGNTNGLIMGNYISLYFAEKYLKEISNEIHTKIIERNIDCKFSYFSDDFYFFCNEKDQERIISIFDKALEKFNLERSDAEIEVWDYLSYNNYNLIEKYWKKIISVSKERFDNYKNDNNLYFSNQLIYRMSMLSNNKSKRTFLNTFFKTTYFHDLDLTKFKLNDYNYHQLCCIFKFSPETLLYSIDKFSENEFFLSEKFKKFLEVRYNEALLRPFNDEQLYYFYAINLLNFDDLLTNTANLVVKIDNQILISYYLQKELFNREQIDILKLKKSERFWFQNYHLILFTDLRDVLENSIAEYLIPEYAKKERQKASYYNFYKINLEDGISLIRTIDEVINILEEYLEFKKEERIEVFGDDQDESFEEDNFEVEQEML